MSRIKVLVSRPKRTLAALATVLVAAGITGASGADFSSQTANPSNVFTAGTLSMSNSLDNAAILTASNMRPGDPAATGTVDITNSGSLSGTFTLSKGTLTNSDATNPLSGKLNLTVLDCGNFASGTPDCVTGVTTKYSGTVAAMGTGYALGSFAAGEKHRYKFSVALDSSAGNAYQAGSSTVQFLWNAAS